MTAAATLKAIKNTAEQGFCPVTTLMKSIFAALALTAVLALPTTLPAQAQDDSTPTGLSLQELRQLMQRQQNLRTEEFRERLRAFQQRRAEQQQLLNQTQAELEAAERRSAELEEMFQSNELELAELEELKNERLGAFGELFGVVRQVAGDTRGNLLQSLTSAQIPGRAEFLETLAETQDLPEVEDLERLWQILVDEALEQGRSVRFSTEVVGANGTPVNTEVVRVGPYVAIADDQYLIWNADTQQLSILARQPRGRFVSLADSFFDAPAGQTEPMVIDPARGQILGQVVEAPTLRERINQGAEIGYIIIVLAIFGLLLGIYLIINRLLVAMAVRRQVKNRNAPSKGNPLGRIMQVYEDNKDADPETLELKLDDAILKETPKLESGLTTVKVLASVSPLLGLLGTVTGMIVTFQAITLFGTGDPKMMAGGISQALITTVLGLVSAIPLLLLHSVAAGLSKSVTDTLEGQAAGLIAERAERDRAPAAA